MSAHKSLPEVEVVGGDVVSVGRPFPPVTAYAHGNIIAALTCEAINVARETGIGPAELRRQRDELLAALCEVADAVEELDARVARKLRREFERARTAIANAKGKS